MSKAGQRILAAMAGLLDHIRDGGEWDTYTTSKGVVVMRPRDSIRAIRDDHRLPPAPRVVKRRSN